MKTSKFLVVALAALALGSGVLCVHTRPGKRITVPAVRNLKPEPAEISTEVWSRSASAIWQATVRFQIRS